ncbi:DMT family transporter [Aeromicrobium sp. Sec7.5]|uniref:DMT family transporter n=1 Tax=Aeromicrobium sp. Sec7.5 TaxID=3121276 RepID=UPI002FE448EF
MRTWLLLLAAIAVEVTASLSLKGALDHRGLYAVVVAGYGSSFALLGLVLRAGMPLGVAYGIWGALGVAGTAVSSSLLFGEPLTGLMVVGMGLVVAGVLLVEIGSQLARRTTEVR